MTPDILKPLLNRPYPKRINLFEDDPDAPNKRRSTARDFVAKQPRAPRPRNSTILVPENDELPRLIREKRGLDEVIAENARTVTAALKTGDHRDLARFHATAVCDFGDHALAEVADFRDQLHKTNPRAAQSWLAAMKKELPAETDRMEKALEIIRASEPSADLFEPDGERRSAGAHFSSTSQPTTDNDITPNNGPPHAEQGTDSDNGAPRDRNERKREMLRDIEWNDHPEPMQTGGVRTYRTDGPVLVGHHSLTPGLDGIEYHVRWWPLGKNGKRKQIVTMPNSEPEVVTSIVIPNMENRSESNQHVPPFDNPYGWEFEITIPPQPARNGNSYGHDLRIYLPKKPPTS